MDEDLSKWDLMDLHTAALFASNAYVKESALIYMFRFDVDYMEANCMREQREAEHLERFNAYKAEIEKRRLWK